MKPGEKWNKGPGVGLHGGGELREEQVEQGMG